MKTNPEAGRSTLGTGWSKKCNGAQQNEQLRSGSIKIAIVSRDAGVRSEIRGIVEFSKSKEIELCGSYRTGQEALKGIIIKRPNIVIIEPELPRLSGIECVERLTPLIPEVHFIMSTRRWSKQLLIECLMCGVTGFLDQPITSTELLRGSRDVSQGVPFFSRAIAVVLMGIFRDLRAECQDSRLTPRERQIYAALFRDLQDKQIAMELGLSRSTVHTHMRHLFTKLGVRSRKELKARLWMPLKGFN